MEKASEPNPPRICVQTGLDVSIIVPVYNSEGVLRDLARRLRETLEPISNNFEIIMVEDVGMDRSWDVIVDLNKIDKRFKGIKLTRNVGQHNSLLCGIRLAQYSVIITIDDDLQHPPEEIPKLLNKLEEGYDVVYGTPQKEKHGLWRNLASQVTKLVLQNAMGADTARKISAFRAFRSKMREAFADYKSPFVNIDVLLAWGTTRFAVVPVSRDPRLKGASNYTFRKLMMHTFNMMTGFSVLPLQLASFMGFLLTLFGLLILAYVIVRYIIQGSQVPGFPFLASMISIFSGAQLFSLGIIGEYLARMHFRLMDMPTYTVYESTSLNRNSDGG